MISSKSASAIARKQAAEQTAKEARRNVFRTAKEELENGARSNMEDKLKPTNRMLDEGSSYIRDQSDSDNNGK